MHGEIPDARLVNQPVPEKLPLANSQAFISYVAASITDRSDDGSDETAFMDIEAGDRIVLNGDFRIQVADMVERNDPVSVIRAWFIAMEKEWGASWSKKSSEEVWKLARNY